RGGRGRRQENWWQENGAGRVLQNHGGKIMDRQREWESGSSKFQAPKSRAAGWEATRIPPISTKHSGVWAGAEGGQGFKPQMDMDGYRWTGGKAEAPTFKLRGITGGRRGNRGRGSNQRSD